MAEPIDYIEYNYDAGPINPMYYTREKLVAVPGSISVKRWAGDESGNVHVTVDQSFPLSEEQFQQIVDALPGFGLVNTPRPVDKWGAPFVGGSPTSLILKSGDLVLTEPGEDLRGDARGLVDLLESFIPEAGKPKSFMVD